VEVKEPVINKYGTFDSQKADMFQRRSQLQVKQEKLKLEAFEQQSTSSKKKKGRSAHLKDLQLIYGSMAPAEEKQDTSWLIYPTNPRKI